MHTTENVTYIWLSIQDEELHNMKLLNCSPRHLFNSNIEKAANGFRAADILPLDLTKFNDFFTILTAQPSLDNMQTPAQPQDSFNRSVALSDVVALPNLPQSRQDPTKILPLNRLQEKSIQSL